MLAISQIAAQVRQVVASDAVEAIDHAPAHPCITIPAHAWLAVAEALSVERDLAFDTLRCLTALDYPAENKMAVAYELFSFTHHHAVCAKVFVPRAQPVLPSVANIWPAANWHEREAYDLFGMYFTGHPDAPAVDAQPRLPRLLLPSDWLGFPLRKDYQFPLGHGRIPRLVAVNVPANRAAAHGDASA